MLTIPTEFLKLPNLNRINNVMPIIAKLTNQASLVIASLYIVYNAKPFSNIIMLSRKLFVEIIVSAYKITKLGPDLLSAKRDNLSYEKIFYDMVKITDNMLRTKEQLQEEILKSTPEEVKDSINYIHTCTANFYNLYCKNNQESIICFWLDYDIQN